MLRESGKVVEIQHIFKKKFQLSVIDKMLEAGNVDNKVSV